MGRPLYSRAFTTTPAVRDPDPSSCEKWSYLNAFDPDSDEFFDNENAVYEDFIGPVTANPEEEEEERELLVVRMGNVSPITSESSLSDDENPLTVGGEDPAHLVADTFHGIGQVDEEESEPAVRVRLATRTLPGEGRWSQLRDQLPRRRQIPATTRGGLYRRAYPSYSRDESIPVPTPTSPIPVPALSRRSTTVDERALLSPSTPPRQTPLTHFPMSPPPTSTPRLYTWASNPTYPSSPSPGSPFTNPHARTSYTHISPAFIRIRDVTV